MCLICDYKKQLQNIGKELGEKLAKTSAPPEMIAMGAQNASDYVYNSILKAVAIHDLRRTFEQPIAQKALIAVYGEERTKQINEIVANIGSLDPKKVADQIKAIKAEVKVAMACSAEEETKALTVKGWMPPVSKKDPKLN